MLLSIPTFLNYYEEAKEYGKKKEKIEKVMMERFGKDSLIALSSVKDTEEHMHGFND